MSREADSVPDIFGRLRVGVERSRDRIFDDSLIRRVRDKRRTWRDRSVASVRERSLDNSRGVVTCAQYGLFRRRVVYGHVLGNGAVHEDVRSNNWNRGNGGPGRIANDRVRRGRGSKARQGNPRCE